MNLHKFIGQTAREAMQKMREALGDEAILIRTRSIPEGIEILAMPDQPGEAPAANLPVGAELGTGRPAQAAASAKASTMAGQPAKLRTPPPEMSTLSFQQFVRQRMTQSAAANPIPSPSPQAVTAPTFEAPAASPAGTGEVANASEQSAVPTLTEVMQADPVTAPHAPLDQRAWQAIQELRGQLSEQMSGLMWAGSVRAQPVKAAILSQLYQAGWSAQLSRKLADRVPADMSEQQAVQWLEMTLERLLLVDPDQDVLLKQGGMFALTGGTGVGKTTSTAKIAAHFALRHGAQSVGLITVDTYRVGGHDQLRSLGRMIGVPVHLAHDVGSLAEFLSLFMNKRLVLIDTVGMGHNDERLEEMLMALRAPKVQRIMVLNCASQAQVTEQVLQRYEASQCSGVILAKTDETSQLAPTLDAVIRHRLRVVGVACGQLIPDHWRPAEAKALIAQAAQADRLPIFENSLDEVLMQVEGRTRPVGAAASRPTSAPFGY